MSEYRTSHGRSLAVREEPKDQIVVEGFEAAEMVEFVDKYNDMALDLKRAMELIRQYQRHLNLMAGPDPSALEANKLMRKYGMPLADLRQLPFRVIVDGIDITEHPDSIPATVVEAEELESGDEEIIDAVEVKELEAGGDAP